MEVNTKKIQSIAWDIGLCDAKGQIVVENGKVLTNSIKIKKRVATNEIGSIFNSQDEEFIRDVYKALGEFIVHLDGLKGMEFAGIHEHVASPKPTNEEGEDFVR